MARARLFARLAGECFPGIAKRQQWLAGYVSTSATPRMTTVAEATRQKLMHQAPRHAITTQGGERSACCDNWGAQRLLNKNGYGIIMDLLLNYHYHY